MPSTVMRLKALALEPVVTGPLLIAVLYYRRPENLIKLPLGLRNLFSSPRTLKALSIFLGLGITGTVNEWLSERARNNWNVDNTWDWPNEIAVVTGGAGGIGGMMVRKLTEKGIKVMVLDLQPAKEGLPNNAFFYRTDVTSSAALHETGEAIRKDHGAPSILINNAGIGFGQTILDEPEDRIRKTFEVNTISHWLTVKEFVPAMIARNHGHVVTIASISSYVVPPQIVDYAATKASAVAFHEGLSNELRSRYKADKVRTTVVTPSWIRTPLVTKLLEHPSFTDSVLEPGYVADTIVKQIISKRSGHLILPKKLTNVSGLRGWPSWMQTVVWKAVSKELPGLERGVL